MDPGRQTPMRQDLLRRLRDPLQLRLVMAAGMLAAWCVLAYSPLSGGIDEAVRERAQAEAHAALAREIEALRVQDARFKSRLPAGTDPNEWVGYLLGGVRRSAVRLLKLEPQPPKTLGPYDIVVVKVELQGSYTELAALLAWIETNPRLLRIDALTLLPTRGLDRALTLSLTVLGVKG